MGIAILWISLFHASVWIPVSPLYFYPLFLLKNIGYGGVDIFLFLSGYGLMTGMITRRYRFSEFYIRRFFRVLPAYWFVALCSLALQISVKQGATVKEVFWKMSTLGFWVHRDKFGWFVPALLAFYLIFPIFFRAYSRSERKFRFVWVLVVLSLLLCCVIIPTRFNYLLIAASRIPVFLIGAHIGYLSFLDEKRLTARAAWEGLFCLAIALTILGYVIVKIPPARIWHYGLWWYPFIIGTFPLCLLLSFLLEKMKETRAVAVLRKFLTFCGRHSLEIYLVQIQSFQTGPNFWPVLVKYFPMLQRLNPGRFLEYALYLAITLALSIPLRKLTRAISERLHPSPYPETAIGELHP